MSGLCLRIPIFAQGVSGGDVVTVIRDVDGRVVVDFRRKTAIKPQRIRIGKRLGHNPESRAVKLRACRCSIGFARDGKLRLLVKIGRRTLTAWLPARWVVT